MLRFAVIETDYLVIGSGLAGLYFALRAAEHGRVVVATKRAPADANTTYAQGGVAGSAGPRRHRRDHVDDTLRVGDGLCHRDIVELCAREAPEHILLVRQRAGRAASTATPTGSSTLGREGGHTRPPHRPRQGHDRLGDPGGAARARRARAPTGSRCCPTTWRSIC